jgi:hypothetical protein
LKFHDRLLHGFERGVLADPVAPAEDKCVVDFFLWPLNAVRQPVEDMIGVVRVDVLDVLYPLVRLTGIAWNYARSEVLIERAHSGLPDPAAFV